MTGKIQPALVNTNSTQDSESEASVESSDNGSSVHTAIGPTPSSSNTFVTLPQSNNSPSINSSPSPAPPPQPPPRGKAKKRGRRTGRSDWEILEGLKEGQTFDFIPKKFEGFLLKKRKWPLKGYHKRYFMLDKGVIVYGKSGWDVARGKIHGSLDAGLSVIATKPRDGRIDIDAEDCIYHLKIKPKEVYMEWLEQLKQHRLYRQHILSFKDLSPTADDSPDLSPLSPIIGVSVQQGLGILPGPNGEGKAESTKSIDKDISLVEKDLVNLQGILDTCVQPKKDEDNKFRDFTVLAKDVTVSLRGIVRSISKAHTANTTIKEFEGGSATLKLALNQVLQQNAELRSKLARIHREAAIEPAFSAMSLGVGARTSDTIRSYGSNSEYYDAMDNAELDRTSSDEESFSSDGDAEVDSIHSSEVSEHPKIETVSALPDKIASNTSLPPPYPTSPPPSIVLNNGTHFSGSEYIPETPVVSHGRRLALPCPAPTGNQAPSVWGILTKNIGKDLSRISMPVTLNEPIGVLQRMCEELEYSELLDSASKETDSVERLTLLAAFAVSGYSSLFWRNYKPFNPLLGESFENVREDKNFRFIAEQVCHHPPISACMAEGRGWKFWEETKPKTKFWGKSMEIQASGTVHVLLFNEDTKMNEHFSYNKATTCVHNLFSPASRWVDLYGDVIIQGGEYSANLKFVKASYWSARKNEVAGTITNSAGIVLRNLFGHWNESFFAGQPPSAKCIWRMGAMPENHSKYYGFTRFAIELNELTKDIKDKLPPTDTRFRPDQRLLEEGMIDDAEVVKSNLEQKQRDRRKMFEEERRTFHPLWFRKTNIGAGSDENESESWEFNGNYWEARKTGFQNVNFQSLW